MPFEKDTFYCLDGGFASHLSTHFSSNIDGDPLWSCRALQDDPQSVVETHVDFIKSGANIITTNTYQASVDLFQKHIKNFKDPVRGPHLLIEEAVLLAEEAIMRATQCPRSVLIAGSVGPYGACLGDGSEYSGNYLDKISREELKAWHLERIRRLSIRKVDIFAVETIPSIDEALAVIDALDEIPGAICWISFSCRDGQRTARGEKLEEVFTKLMQHPSFRFKVVAVGVNCVNPKDVTSILTLFNSVNHWSAWPNVFNYEKVPYVVYPNAGSIDDWDHVNKCWAKPGDLADILDNVKEWMCLGANIIGGCCRVGPDAISKISEAVIANIFDVRRFRESEAKKTRSTSDDWSSVLDRLKKSSYADQKKQEMAAEQAFKDIGDGGGLFSRMHAQMEQILREAEPDEVQESQK